MEMRRPYSDISGHSNLGPNSNPTYPYPVPSTPPYNINYAALPYFAHPVIAPPSSPQYYYYAYGYDPSQYNRKRQRRQAAAVTVESIWGNNNANMGRKSTAQPRPVLTVPPRGIGPIVDPNENDVLCGRGGRINQHTGNIRFRDVIASKKKDYLAPSTKKLEKAHIAAAIVNGIREMEPPGRFLKEDRDTGLWFDIGDAKAIKKTGQALREDAPDIRHEIEGDSSGDEKGKADSPTAVKSEDVKPTKEETPKVASKSKPTPPKKTNDRHNTATPQTSNVAWQQRMENPGMISSHDYQAQVAMPPPFPQQVNPYLQLQQQSMQNQGFETRTIPIHTPMPAAIYSLPNQLATGARQVGRRVANTSRHAMETLSQAGGFGPGERMGNSMTPDDVAFGRQFHPPANSILSNDNTMSTISGLSEQPSSMFGTSAIMSDLGRGSAISGLTGLSGLSAMDASAMSPRSSARAAYRDPSLRISQLGLGVSGMGQSSRREFADAMLKSSHISDLSVSNRSMGSMSRSLSFNDMVGIVADEPWKPIAEDEAMFQDAPPPEASLLSGEASRRHPGRPQYRDSSAMSVTSMSTASSNRWLHGMNEPHMDDGRSVLSEMSADLLALDLAAQRGDSR